MKLKYLLAITACVVSISAQAFTYRVELTAADPGFEGCEANLRDIGDIITLQSAKFENGKAIFTGEIGRTAYASILTYNSDNTKSAIVYLVLEPDTVFANTEEISPVGGGELTRRYIDCHSSLKDASEDEMPALLKKIMAENPDNGIGESVLEYFPLYCSPDDWAEMSRSLSPDITGLDYYRETGDLMEKMRATWIGRPFAEIIGRNADGGEARLSDYVGKGKYVLADFWASWCKPCIAIGKEYIMPLYDKYKDNPDFMILGIAISDPAEATIKAAEKHGYAWPQILECGTRPLGTYSFRGIPKLILFDPEGKILDRNITPAKLESIVEKLLSD